MHHHHCHPMPDGPRPGPIRRPARPFYRAWQQLRRRAATPATARPLRPFDSLECEANAMTPAPLAAGR